MARTPKPAAGRPKDLEKRASILAAALERFLALGFERTNMDVIAAKAGVSKLTVYGHFKDKETLFRHAVTERIGQLQAAPASLPNFSRPVKDVLMAMSLHAVRLLFAHDMIRLFRLMESEAASAMKTKQVFYAAGSERLITLFSECLREMDKQNRLKVPQPGRTAAHWLSLLAGDLHRRALLDIAHPSQAVLRTHVEDVVALLLRAYDISKKAKRR